MAGAGQRSIVWRKAERGRGLTVSRRGEEAKGVLHRLLIVAWQIARIPALKGKVQASLE